MGGQLLTSVVRCGHWEGRARGSFAHLPLCSVSVWPCWAVPVIVGGVSLAGAGPGGATMAVASEVAGAPEPPALLAVSCTLIVWATSAATGTYVCSVAPEIGRQLL